MTCPSQLALEGYLLDPQRSAVAPHVGDCPSCADRLATMRAQGEEFAREVFPATIDAVLDAAQRRSRRPWRSWFALGVPLLAASAAGLLLLVRPPGPPAGYTGVKGSGLGFTVWAASPGGPREVADGEALPANAALRFAVHPSRPCHLAVISVDASGQVSPLFPAPGAAASQVGPGPLPGGAVLDGKAGPERIFAVCSQSALPFEELARSARSGGTGEEAVRGLRELPGVAASQATVLLEKRP